PRLEATPRLLDWEATENQVFWHLDGFETRGVGSSFSHRRTSWFGGPVVVYSLFVASCFCCTALVVSARWHIMLNAISVAQSGGRPMPSRCNEHQQHSCEG